MPIRYKPQNRDFLPSPQKQECPQIGGILHENGIAKLLLYKLHGLAALSRQEVYACGIRCDIYSAADVACTTGEGGGCQYTVGDIGDGELYRIGRA